ncbi:enoyl-[acyl-carrier protein] reductase II [Thermosporothrix hazakensis]|jgi:enoyl-[acyl-carrier protein] reductase II|uniref:Enoyl-[acyl-carrier protein] reductase II n=1 Tax=Thermosporothrix hazakensis TaxID=644383 RepID=A0A326U9P7_THEHA|nr:nitronate monooxygenase [Thermosporothrix hazakensis]PZW32117.1 enoyl-[acyl-carrier protein] reductase II [Thermosporothrix hazakensis]GCE49555.1 nitronate monooxygenase [Thermosporothrix hazakensis]
MVQLPERMQTRFTELVGVRYPIVQGGLAHLSFAELAAAVSNAGGLGQIGCACFQTPQELQENIQKARRLTNKPFGVNFPIGHIPLEPFLDAALEEKPAVISITGGNPEKLLKRIQQSGVMVKTMVLVAGVRAAKKAEALGADAVIAVGFEGGGHLGRDDIGTMVLTPRVIESVRIPVLASGGIADGRGLAAALALGADGVELGTRFVAVQESNAHPHYQQALIEAQETDTLIIERAIGRPARALKGTRVEQILQVEKEMEQDALPAEERVQRLLPYIRGSVNVRAALAGALDEGFVWAGQVTGLIHDIPTTRELIERMVSEAYAITRRIQATFEI